MINKIANSPCNEIQKPFLNRMLNKNFIFFKQRNDLIKDVISLEGSGFELLTMSEMYYFFFFYFSSSHIFLKINILLTFPYMMKYYTYYKGLKFY